MKMDTRLDLFRRLGFDNRTGCVRALRRSLVFDADMLPRRRRRVARRGKADERRCRGRAHPRGIEATYRVDLKRKAKCLPPDLYKCGGRVENGVATLALPQRDNAINLVGSDP